MVTAMSNAFHDFIISGTACIRNNAHIRTELIQCFKTAHIDELRSDKVRTALARYASLLKDRSSEFNALIQHTAH